MNALVFIIDTLVTLALVAFLLRLLLQLSRADFRNPVSQAVVRLTNPLIMPLRRILPPLGRIDTGSVVAVLLVGLFHAALLYLLRGLGLPAAGPWIEAAVLIIVRTTLWTYFYAVFLYALLSLVAPGGYSPVQALLASLCEPVLRPFRRLIPPIAGLDLSPLWVLIGIQALLILVR
jgi:YggT family protein